jgi:hypothetical protein
MSSVRLRSLIAALLLVAPLVAGCGGAGTTASETAAFAPRQAAVFASINTDFESGQWDAVRDLVAKFPDGDRALDFLDDELRDEGISFQEDIRPALGPEVGIVLLQLDEDKVVFFTQPKDAAKLRQVIETGDDPGVTRMVDGWMLAAEDEATLDEFEQAREAGSLSDSQEFQDAMATVSDDPLAAVYVSGAAFQEALEADSDVPTGVYDNFFPGGKVPSFALSVRAEENGVRVEGGGKFSAEDAGLFAPYEAKLPDEVPAGALAYASFNDLESFISKIRDAAAEADPEFERNVGQLESMLGVSIEEDLAPLFAHEGAFYVRPGAPIPEFTLVLDVDDTQQAVATVDKLVEGLRAFSSEVPEPRDTEISGVTARELPLGFPVSLFYAGFDGHLVVTSARSGIADLRADGERLSDDPVFQDARDAADMPDETTGFAYVNLQDLVPFILGFAEGGDLPEEVRSNLEPLRYLLLFGAQDGDTATFGGFLGIE